MEEHLTCACQAVSFSAISLHDWQAWRTSRTQTGTFTLSSYRKLIICPNALEALIRVLLVSAEHTLWIFCRVVLFLLIVSSIFLSNALQVLRPGSRYKVSVTGVRTGNESGTISTEFTTGEV